MLSKRFSLTARLRRQLQRLTVTFDRTSELANFTASAGTKAALLGTASPQPIELPQADSDVGVGAGAPERWWSNLVWAYQTRFDGSRGHAGGLTQRLVFVARSLYYRRACAAWFAFLRGSSLHKVAALQPNFFERVHKPFFDARLTAVQRAALLINHHQVFLGAFGDQFAHPMLLESPLLLATLKGKTGEHYGLALRREGQFDKEGCVSLQLLHNGRSLLTLSFSLVGTSAGLIVKIGGIQGGIDSRDALRSATRELQGIQPRLLLLKALRDLGALLGARSVEAISNQHHVYKSARYRHKKKVNIDYDALWQMTGGVMQANGRYGLALAEAAPDETSQPVRKRAEYRRRYALLADMQQQLQRAVTSPQLGYAS